MGQEQVGIFHSQRDGQCVCLVNKDQPLPLLFIIITINHLFSTLELDHFYLSIAYHVSLHRSGTMAYS